MALIAGITELALAAGKVILYYYRDGAAVSEKADSSPVTEADQAAEALILAGLERLTPTIPVIAEEAMAAGHEPEIAGDRFWLVDPLDGTREFLARNGEFTVNIALIEAGRPALGVVHVPTTGVTYTGAGPGTATRMTNGGPPLGIRARRAPPAGLVVTHSRTHANRDDLATYYAGLTVTRRLVTGSSVKFCLIAAGEADLYPRLGPTMEWDVAAGHAVLAAAWGTIRTLAGTELGYAKPGFRNPPFVARGRTATEKDHGGQAA